MDQEMMTQVEQTLCQFRMPRYHEIPDVGLYLEQIVDISPIAPHIGHIVAACCIQSLVLNDKLRLSLGTQFNCSINGRNTQCE